MPGISQSIDNTIGSYTVHYCHTDIPNKTKGIMVDTEHTTCMLHADHIIQWNLSIVAAHGPEINGCNREVAALKKCLVYGILPIGA